jgi:hypothetical protein
VSLGPHVRGWVAWALGARRTGFPGVRAGESSLKRDSPRVQQLRFRILIPSVSRMRGHSTWCATCSDGARRGSPDGSAPAPLPSAILPLESLCSSSPTSPTGWRYQSRRSSCCCWRISAFSFNTSRPTPSSRRSSSPTCVRCLWGWRRAPPSSAISSCW